MAWETWNIFPEIPDTLALMLQQQHSDVDAALDLLERYVVLLYDKTSSSCHVNEARLVQKARCISYIPPTQASLSAQC